MNAFLFLLADSVRKKNKTVRRIHLGKKLPSQMNLKGEVMQRF